MEPEENQTLFQKSELLIRHLRCSKARKQCISHAKIQYVLIVVGLPVLISLIPQTPAGVL